MTTSKQKAQGTGFSYWLRRKLVASALPTKALPEGGPLDEADLETMVYDTNPANNYFRRVVIEARARQNMSVHVAMAKAIGKEERAAKREDRPPDAVWLVWKRFAPIRPGEVRRRALGPPLVIMELDEAIRLAGGRPEAQVIADAEA